MDLKLVKDYLRQMEQLSKDGHYKEFEVALLVHESSNDLSEEQITDELINAVYSVSSDKDNLIDYDLSQDIDTILELAKNTENINEKEEDTDYER